MGLRWCKQYDVPTFVVRFKAGMRMNEQWHYVWTEAHIKCFDEMTFKNKRAFAFRFWSTTTGKDASIGCNERTNRIRASFWKWGTSLGHSTKAHRSQFAYSLLKMTTIAIGKSASVLSAFRISLSDDRKCGILIHLPIVSSSGVCHRTFIQNTRSISFFSLSMPFVHKCYEWRSFCH